MTSIKAKKTEYMGTVFRSKSEAMFARLLDLTCDTVWFYEPEQFRLVDKYVPDFLIIKKKENKPRLDFIEYKPKEPTASYLGNLVSHRLPEILKIAKSCYAKSSFDHQCFSIGFRVVCFDFFQSNSSLLELTFAQEAFKKNIFHVDASHLDDIKNYRFDLR